MRSNVLRWLWGLLPLAVIGWLALTLEKTGIEADLAARAQAALEKSGVSWATVSFDGRDATLTGQAVDDGDTRAAVNTVASLWGTRQVDNRATLIDAVSNYTWNALIQGNRVRLEGYVPNDKTRREIMGIAKGTFPGREIEDKLVLGRGAPPADQWLGGISFGLKQLARLKPGAQIALVGTDLSVDGEAEDAAAYTAAKDALRSNVPQGINLKSDHVLPPTVKPFTWSLTRKSGQVEQAGYVPDKATRAAVATAISKLPGATLADRTGIGGGAPQGFQQAATALAEAVVKLEGGAAEIRDTAAVISGTAADDSVAAALRQSLHAGLPPGFRLTDNIQAKAPEAKAPAPPPGPYLTTAALDRGSVTLDGAIPAEDMRTAVLSKAAARLPGRRVDDRMKVAPGAPDNWLVCLESGLAGLAGLEPGARAVLSDRALQVTGEAASEQAMAAVQPAIASVPGAGSCATAVNVALSAGARAEIERRRKEAEDEARRKVAAATPPAPVVRTPELDRCQQALSSAASEGVILFERSSAELDPQSAPTLKKLAELAKTCPKARIEIEGHTDDEGGSERNRRLSEKRAQAVVDFLTAQGVETSRLAAVGYGEERPIAPNDTPANRAKNRRIEFTVKPD